MRRILIAAVIAFSALGAAGCATKPVQAPFVERTEVMSVARAITDRYASAWNASDMAAFGALYLPDARYVNTSGEFWRGRTMIVDVHRRNRAAYAPSVRMTTQLEGARAITDDVIIAVVKLEIVNDPAKPGAVSASRVTLTLAKRDDDWRIAQAHAYPVTSAAQN